MINKNYKDKYITFGLSGFLNCCNINPASPREANISSALRMAPFIPKDSEFNIKKDGQF